VSACSLLATVGIPRDLTPLDLLIVNKSTKAVVHVIVLPCFLDSQWWR